MDSAVLSDDLLRRVLGSLLPVERLALFGVCRRWQEAQCADLQLWQRIAVVPAHPNRLCLQAHHKVPFGDMRDPEKGEYGRARMALSGILLLTRHKLRLIPDAAWVKVLIIDTSRADAGESNSLAYLDDMSDREEAETTLREEQEAYNETGARLLTHLGLVLDALCPFPKLERLRFALDWMETVSESSARTALAKVAAWMRTLPAIEYLDLGYAYRRSWVTGVRPFRAPGLTVRAKPPGSPWTLTWQEGVPEPRPLAPSRHRVSNRTRSARAPSPTMRWNFAADLPKLFPNLRGLTYFQTAGISLNDISKWPTALRSQLDVVSLSTGDLARRSTPFDITLLPALFPNVRSLRLSIGDVNGRDDAANSQLLEALSNLSPALQSLYLLFEDRPCTGDWQHLGRLPGLKDLVVIADLACESRSGVEILSHPALPGSSLAEELSAALPAVNVLVLHSEMFGCESEYGHDRLLLAAYEGEGERGGSGYSNDRGTEVNTGVHPEQRLSCDVMCHMFLPGQCETWQLFACKHDINDPYGSCGSYSGRYNNVRVMRGPLPDVLAGLTRMPESWNSAARSVVEDLKLAQAEFEMGYEECWRRNRQERIEMGFRVLPGGGVELGEAEYPEEAEDAE